jgi:hypothetical protein
MRAISFSGSSIITTNDVSEALTQLARGLAMGGVTDVLSIPICDGRGGETTAELVVGPGMGMMSVPSAWVEAEPDFSRASTMLRMHAQYPFSRQPQSAVSEDESAPSPLEWWDW